MCEQERRQIIGEIDPRVREHPEYRRFLAAVHAHFVFLLKVENLNQLQPQLPTCRPLTLLELHAFAKGSQPGVQITEDNYRFDFHLSRSHPFNVEAIRVFTASFIRHVNNGRHDLSASTFGELLDPRHVEAAIYRHTKSAKTVFNRLYPSAVVETTPVGDPGSTRRGTRKICLYKKRSVVVETYYPEHMDLLRRAGMSAVSSDESSDEHDTFEVISPGWRSSAFQAWMRSLNPLVAMHERGQPGRSRRPLTGRPRELTTRIHVDAVPPHGLPQNCFSSAWLATLSAHEAQALDIEEGYYDLTPIDNLDQILDGETGEVDDPGVLDASTAVELTAAEEQRVVPYSSEFADFTRLNIEGQLLIIMSAMKRLEAKFDVMEDRQRDISLSLSVRSALDTANHPHANDEDVAHASVLVAQRLESAIRSLSGQQVEIADRMSFVVEQIADRMSFVLEHLRGERDSLHTHQAAFGTGLLEELRAAASAAGSAQTIALNNLSDGMRRSQVVMEYSVESIRSWVVVGVLGLCILCGGILLRFLSPSSLILMIAAAVLCYYKAIGPVPTITLMILWLLAH
ncbi:hypothetical protein PENSPDRAFT_694971 [Peniophora sp. CONT]|nr:hypothetical protein PENSPDRAFT_694971 [Peniophora sp. CONT]